MAAVREWLLPSPAGTEEVALCVPLGGLHLYEDLEVYAIFLLLKACYFKPTMTAAAQSQKLSVRDAFWLPLQQGLTDRQVPALTRPHSASLGLLGLT